MALSKTEGLLAFIWDIYTDDTKAGMFKTDPWTFMETYRLTVEQQRVIWETGLERENPANVQAWRDLGAGRTASRPSSGTLVDGAWPNDGAMTLLGAMIIDVLGNKPQWDDAW